MAGPGDFPASHAEQRLDAILEISRHQLLQMFGQLIELLWMGQRNQHQLKTMVYPFIP